MKAPKPLTIVIKLGEYFHSRIIKSCLFYACWWLFVGTSSIVDEKTHEPLLSILTLIVETAVKLHKDGHKVIIVSSGAIGVGLRRMDLDKRPKHLPRIQVICCLTLRKELVLISCSRLWQLSVNVGSSVYGTACLAIYVNQLLRSYWPEMTLQM